MSRRLLDTKAGRGLYEYNDQFGRYQVWEPLDPRLPNLSDIAPLTSSERPVSSPEGGLYGGRSEEQRRNDTRRKADAALEKYGLRPRRRWL